MAVKLDPKLGGEVQDAIHMIMDNSVINTVGKAFELARALGDDTPIVEAVKDKFIKFQDKYNDEVVPVAKKVQDSMSGFIDSTTLLGNLQSDSSMKDVEVGTVQDNMYDAMNEL